MSSEWMRAEKGKTVRANIIRKTLMLSLLGATSGDAGSYAGIILLIFHS
ncbi:hypothetical protein OAM34_02965 [Alphaproteobacteria bacterium]|nr:hypothetical protein [Alphaproteobacteria bacterium]